MTVKTPTSLSSGSISDDEHLSSLFYLTCVPDSKVSACLFWAFHRQLCSSDSSVMITYSAPVQVSGRCPGGGDWACHFCLSNEITSHSGPVHRKTQRDQCRTAGLEWLGVLVEAASCKKNMFCFGSPVVILYFNSILLVTAKHIRVFFQQTSVFFSVVLLTTFQNTTGLQYLKY